MSYILDALNKSDRERQRKQSPSLQSVHSAFARPAVQRHSQILLSLAVALLLALLLSVWWLLGPGLKSLQSVDTVAAAQDSVAVDAAADPIAKAKVVLVPTPSTVVVPFADLPVAVRQQIPALTFSFHVFSAQINRRTIIINGSRYRQGGEVAPGLLLEEITERGVILVWRRYRFSIPVVEQW